jgi:tRNA(Ile2) C34 agmatinyltransferase TiaS
VSSANERSRMGNENRRRPAQKGLGDCVGRATLQRVAAPAQAALGGHAGGAGMIPGLAAVRVLMG